MYFKENNIKHVNHRGQEGGVKHVKGPMPPFGEGGGVLNVAEGFQRIWKKEVKNEELGWKM